MSTIFGGEDPLKKALRQKQAQIDLLQGELAGFHKKLDEQKAAQQQANAEINRLGARTRDAEAAQERLTKELKQKEELVEVVHGRLAAVQESRAKLEARVKDANYRIEVADQAQAEAGRAAERSAKEAEHYKDSCLSLQQSMNTKVVELEAENRRLVDRCDCERIRAENAEAELRQAQLQLSEAGTKEGNASLVLDKLQQELKSERAEVAQLTRKLEDLEGSCAAARSRAEDAERGLAFAEAARVSLQEKVELLSQQLGQKHSPTEAEARWKLERDNLTGRVQEAERELAAAKTAQENLEVALEKGRNVGQQAASQRDRAKGDMDQLLQELDVQAAQVAELREQLGLTQQQCATLEGAVRSKVKSMSGEAEQQMARIADRAGAALARLSRRLDQLAAAVKVDVRAAYVPRAALQQTEQSKQAVQQAASKQEAAMAKALEEQEKLLEDKSQALVKSLQATHEGQLQQLEQQLEQQKLEEAALREQLQTVQAEAAAQGEGEKKLAEQLRSAQAALAEKDAQLEAAAAQVERARAEAQAASAREAELADAAASEAAARVSADEWRSRVSSRLEEQLLDLRKDLEHEQAAAAGAREQVAALTAELDAKAQLVEESGGKVQALREEVEDERQRRSALLTDLQSSSEGRREQERKAVALGGELGHQAERVADLEKERALLQEQVAAVRLELSDTQQLLEAGRKLHKRTEEELANRLQELGQVQDLQAELTASCAAAEQGLAAAKGSISKLEAQQSQLQEAAEERQRQLDASHEETAVLESLLQQSRHQVSEKEGMLQELRSSLDSRALQAKDLSAAAAGSDRQAQQLQAKLSSAEEEARRALAQAQAELQEAKAACLAEQQKAAQLAAGKQSLEQQLAEEKCTSAERQLAVRDAEARVEQLEATKKQLEEKLEAMAWSLRGRTAQIEVLEKDLAVARASAEDVRLELKELAAAYQKLSQAHSDLQAASEKLRWRLEHAGTGPGSNGS